MLIGEEIKVMNFRDGFNQQFHITNERGSLSKVPEIKKKDIKVNSNN